MKYKWNFYPTHIHLKQLTYFIFAHDFERKESTFIPLDHTCHTFNGDLILSSKLIVIDILLNTNPVLNPNGNTISLPTPPPPSPSYQPTEHSSLYTASKHVPGHQSEFSIEQPVHAASPIFLSLLSIPLLINLIVCITPLWLPCLRYPLPRWRDSSPLTMYISIYNTQSYRLQNKRIPALTPVGVQRFTQPKLQQIK